MGFAGEAASVTTALSQDEEAVDQAIATNSWVIIFFHHVVPDADVSSYLPYGIDATDFSTLLSYISASGVRVMTTNQALNLGSTYPATTSNKVDVEPSLPTLDAGQSETFTASAWGGTGPYTYRWYLDGSRTGRNSPNYTFDSAYAGAFSLYVNVTDSSSVPVTIESRTLSVTVNSALAAPTALANLNTIDQGQTSSLTSTDITQTGTGPYTYQWMQMAPGDSSFSLINNANLPNYDYATDSYTATGPWDFILQVTDSADTPVTTTSNPVTVQVNSALAAPTALANLNTIDQGQTSSLTSTDITQTGTGPYTYQWMQMAPGDSSYSMISEANASSYSFATSDATVKGSWSFELQVTDGSGEVVDSTAVSVRVDSVLVAPVVSVSAGTVDQGQTSVLNIADVSTGTSPYGYEWFEKAPEADSYVPIGGVTSSSYSFATTSSTTTGAWSFMLQVTDATGAAVNSTAVSVTVNTAPTVNISSASQTMYVGQPQAFTATALGGSGDMTYQWYLNNNLIGTNSSSYNYTPNNAGLASIYVKVTDSATNPQTATSNTATITVTAAISPTPTQTPTPVTTTAPVPTPYHTAVPTPATSSKPTTSPAPTVKPSPTPTASPSASRNQTQSSWAQDTIYGVAVASIIVIIVVVTMLLLRKSKKSLNRLINEAYSPVRRIYLSVRLWLLCLNS